MEEIGDGRAEDCSSVLSNLTLILFSFVRSSSSVGRLRITFLFTEAILVSTVKRRLKTFLSLFGIAS